MDVHVLRPRLRTAWPTASTFHDWSIVRSKPWTAARRHPAAARPGARVEARRDPPALVHRRARRPAARRACRRRRCSGRLPAPCLVFQAVAGQPPATPGRGGGARPCSRRTCSWPTARTRSTRASESGIVLPSRPLGVAVDAAHFHPVDEEERERLRADAADLGDDRILVCVGRIAWQKGQDQLVAQWEKAPLPATDTRARRPRRHARSSARSCAARVGEVDPMRWRAGGRAPVGVGGQTSWSCRRDTRASPWSSGGDGVRHAGGRDRLQRCARGARRSARRAWAPSVPLGDMEALLREARRRLDDADAARRPRPRPVPFAPEPVLRPALVADRLEEAYRDGHRPFDAPGRRSR